MFIRTVADEYVNLDHVERIRLSDDKTVVYFYFADGGPIEYSLPHFASYDSRFPAYRNFIDLVDRIIKHHG